MSDGQHAGGSFEVVDLTERIETPAAQALLLYVVYPPTAKKLARVIRQYQTSSARLVGVEVAGALVSALGYEIVGGGQAIIRHIVVAPDARLYGIGRRMVEWLMAHDGVSRVTAETDHDAVGFYRRCGFEVTSLGEVYPGTERFRCELESPLPRTPTMGPLGCAASPRHAYHGAPRLRRLPTAPSPVATGEGESMCH